MERENLFRGRQLHNERKWIYGSLMKYQSKKTKEIIYMIYNLNGIYECIIPETRGQYTGLTDKNGVKIYEGDIIKTKKYGKIVEHSNVNDYDIFTVTYEPCTFRLVNKNRGFNLVDDGYSELEVIGNIHDSPELMKGVQENDP